MGPRCRNTIAVVRATIILTVLVTSACSSPAPAPPAATRAPEMPPRLEASAVTPALEQAAAAYRAKKDLVTLENTAALLEICTPRADVERLLGRDDGYDDPAIFYASNRANAAGERIGLTADYSLWYDDGRPSRASDRLQRWMLGSGNRFESADAKIPKREDPAFAPSAAAQAAAASYREHHDYASLRQAVAALRLGTSRSDAARLLGPPSDCAAGGDPCHYVSERVNDAGLPLGVSLEYRVANTGKDGTETITTDRVQALMFGPVARSK
jgi:hypothetical protein